VKIGEGTYGEAFRAGETVCKVVPIDGDLLVNGEIQKVCPCCNGLPCQSVVPLRVLYNQPYAFSFRNLKKCWKKFCSL